MGTRFTYKSFSLIIGILVAVIVVVTLWMAMEQKERQSQGAVLLPTITLPNHPAKVIEKITGIKSLH